MPQLSLYLDDVTLHKIEAGAKISEISVSKFVATALKDYFSNNWPEGYASLFGSIQDETLTADDDPDVALDAPREEI